MQTISAVGQNHKPMPHTIENDAWLTEWIKNNLSTDFPEVINDPEAYHLQVIYTAINKNDLGIPSFSTHTYGLHGSYHYPASTVKLAAAVLALEKLNKLGIKGLDKQSRLTIKPLRANETAVAKDESNVSGGYPTIEHYIKKILLVSDNDAFNRLYEFIGQEAFNKRLHELGFIDAQLIHRLSIALSEDENRATNAFEFFDGENRLVYKQPAQYSKMVYAERKDSIGKGFMTSGDNFDGAKLVTKPMDFSKKNRWPLMYHHTLVQWLMFPETQQKKSLLLTQDDYDFLRQYMCMLPQQSTNPVFTNPPYWPSYVKFLVYGSDKQASIPDHIKIYNKVGDAYGFLIDGAYIKDSKANVDFLLSAVIYCNSDGILNDDNYDYDTLGFPFMKKLGEAFLLAEKNNEK